MDYSIRRTNSSSSQNIIFPGSFRILSSDLILCILDHLFPTSLILGLLGTCKMFGKLVSNYDYSHNFRLRKGNLDQSPANFMSLSCSSNSSKKPIYFKEGIQFSFGKMPKPEGFFVHAFILSNPREALPKTIHSMVIGVSKIGCHLSSTSKRVDSNLGKILESLFCESFTNLKVLGFYWIKIDDELIGALENLELDTLDLNECFFCDSSPILDMRHNNVKRIQFIPNRSENGKLNVKFIGHVKRLTVYFSPSLQTSGIKIDAVSCPQLEYL
jgi:hypothetical protein